MKPLVFDLFCGLFGWGESFAAAGYKVIGFDVENQFANFGKQMPANCELVLRDVRSLTGADMVKQYGVPACIVASPPCQEFSYMAMPWSKAKEKMRKIQADPAEQARLTELFNQCFRIQREVSEAAGRYVPMVVENVRGAQRWVGRSKANFGSFHLYGDVPALMPIPGKASKVPGFRFDGSGKSFQTASVLKGEGRKHDVSFHGQPLGKNEGPRKCGSKSPKRKQASAEIAKIPPALAQWIARCFKPAEAKVAA